MRGRRHRFLAGRVSDRGMIAVGARQYGRRHIARRGEVQRLRCAPPVDDARPRRGPGVYADQELARSLSVGSDIGVCNSDPACLRVGERGKAIPRRPGPDDKGARRIGKARAGGGAPRSLQQARPLNIRGKKYVVGRAVDDLRVQVPGGTR